MWGDTAYLELWLEDEGHKISEVDALETDGKKVTWREMLDEIIKRKQFELTGFSYSSMDEFLTSLYGQYQDFDVGREYLAKEFKSKAKVAWYVDNFGHKHTTPYVLKTNGFQSMVLGRMSYRQLQKMKANSGLQFMWDSGINNTEIYTHFLSNQYEWPSWKFDFDRHDSCNIGELLGILARFANKQVGIYPHKKQILIIMGDDFRFVKAEKAFNCLDTLVRAAGSGKYRNWGQGKKQLELRYSTISEYMQSLQEDKSVQLGSVKGDFGPYNDRRPENYWTGIYSTRPALKYSIRYTERLVKQAESVFALAKLFARKSVSNSGENLDGIALNSTVITLLEGKLTDSQKQLSLGYHHDSITGVCTAQTYKNYMSRLQEANKKSREIISTCMRAVLNSKEAAKGGGDIEYVGPSIGTVYGAESVEDEVETQIEQHGSAYIDSTRCNNVKCKDVLLAVVNSASLYPQNRLVTLVLFTKDIEIKDVKKDSVVALQIETIDEVNNKYRISFIAESIPQLSYKTYLLYKKTPELEPKASDGTDTSINKVNTFVEHVKLTKHNTVSLDAKLSNKEVKNKDNMGLKIEYAKGVIKIITPEKKEYFIEMRHYFVSKFRGSGAYLFHSLFQMYFLLFFYIFVGIGGGLALCLYMTSTRKKRKFSQTLLANPNIYDKDLPVVDGSEKDMEARSKQKEKPSISINMEGENSRYLEKALIELYERLASVTIGAMLGGVLTLMVLQAIPESIIARWTNNEMVLPLLLVMVIMGYVLGHFFAYRARSLKITIKNSLNSIIITYIMLGVALGMYYILLNYPTLHSRRDYPISPIVKVVTGPLMSSISLYYESAKVKIIQSKHLDGDIRILTTIIGKRKNIESLLWIYSNDKSQNKYYQLDGYNNVTYNYFTCIPGNYQPIVDSISNLPSETASLKHGGVQIKVTQPIGGTLLKNKYFEFLLFRRFKQDDYRGLWGILADKSKVSISHYIKNQNSNFDPNIPVHVIPFEYRNTADNKVSGVSNKALENDTLLDLSSALDPTISSTIMGEGSIPTGIDIIGIRLLRNPYTSTVSAEFPLSSSHLYVRFSTFGLKSYTKIRLYRHKSGQKPIGAVYSVTNDYGLFNSNHGGSDITRKEEISISLTDGQYYELNFEPNTVSLYHFVLEE